MPSSEPHAHRPASVKPRLLARLAGLGRLEGTVQDGPGPVRSRGDQDPEGQGEAHSRRSLSGHQAGWRRSSNMALAATTRPTALALAKHAKERLNEHQPTADPVGDDDVPGGYRNGGDGYRRTEDCQ